MNKENIISHYMQNVFTDKHQELMKKTLDYVFDERVQKIRFTSLYRYFDKKYSKTDILFVIQKLIIGKYKLLDINYEFYDEEDDNEVPYPVSKKEFKKVELDKYYIHPVTGNEISVNEFKKNTGFYFTTEREALSQLVSV